MPKQNPFGKIGEDSPPETPTKKGNEPEPERTLLIKHDVCVYRIPPQTKAVGWKATDWNLENPDWKGKMRMVSMGPGAKILLEEKATDGKIYAVCPIETYPGLAIQSVADSSRYFVIKVMEGGKTAYLGLGFSDRADSFDVNTTLHDHFKGIKVEAKLEQEAEEPHVPLDLAFKQGETIKVNINIPSKKRTKSPGRATGAGAGLSLPPPPTPAGFLPAPPSPAMARLNLGGAPVKTAPAPKGGSTQWVQF